MDDPKVVKQHMTKNTQFKSTIAEIVDVPVANAADGINNPFLTRIRFVFADNQGNGNRQGIEEEDFDRIAQSAINMPIKIKFSESDIEGHEMSIPIGHITKMDKVTDGDVPQLVGEALLYREEFPQEVEFLKSKFAKAASGEDDAPGISWELAYENSILKSGVEWLKQAVTMAATFVKVPAYGNRTRLLAIAQQLTDDELTKRVEEIMKLQTVPDKGGNKVEEELEKAKAALADAQAKETEAQAKVTELTDQLTQAQLQNDVLTQENTGYKAQATLATRMTKISEAGLKFELEGEALQAKQAFWLSLSEEAFDGYIADLTAAKASAGTVSTANASLGGSLPKFTAVAGQENISLDDLKLVARRASRGDLADLQ